MLDLSSITSILVIYHNIFSGIFDGYNIMTPYSIGEKIPVLKAYKETNRILKKFNLDNEGLPLYVMLSNFEVLINKHLIILGTKHKDTKIIDKMDKNLTHIIAGLQILRDLLENSEETPHEIEGLSYNLSKNNINGGTLTNIVSRERAKYLRKKTEKNIKKNRTLKIIKEHGLSLSQKLATNQDFSDLVKLQVTFRKLQKVLEKSQEDIKTFHLEYFNEVMTQTQKHNRGETFNYDSVRDLNSKIVKHIDEISEKIDIDNRNGKNFNPLSTGKRPKNNAHTKRIEKERIEKERIEKERIEKERIEKERKPGLFNGSQAEYFPPPRSVIPQLQLNYLSPREHMPHTRQLLQLRHAENNPATLQHTGEWQFNNRNQDENSRWPALREAVIHRHRTSHRLRNEVLRRNWLLMVADKKIIRLSRNVVKIMVDDTRPYNFDDIDDEDIQLMKDFVRKSIKYFSGENVDVALETKNEENNNASFDNRVKEIESKKKSRLRTIIQDCSFITFNNIFYISTITLTFNFYHGPFLGAIIVNLVFSVVLYMTMGINKTLLKNDKIILNGILKQILSIVLAWVLFYVFNYIFSMELNSMYGKVYGNNRTMTIKGGKKIKTRKIIGGATTVDKVLKTIKNFKDFHIGLSLPNLSADSTTDFNAGYFNNLIETNWFHFDDSSLPSYLKQSGTTLYKFNSLIASHAISMIDLYRKNTGIITSKKSVLKATNYIELTDSKPITASLCIGFGQDLTNTTTLTCNPLHTHHLSECTSKDHDFHENLIGKLLDLGDNVPNYQDIYFGGVDGYLWGLTIDTLFSKPSVYTNRKSTIVSFAETRTFMTYKYAEEIRGDTMLSRVGHKADLDLLNLGSLIRSDNENDLQKFIYDSAIQLPTQTRQAITRNMLVPIAIAGLIGGDEGRQIMTKYTCNDINEKDIRMKSIQYNKSRSSSSSSGGYSIVENETCKYNDTQFKDIRFILDDGTKVYNPPTCCKLACASILIESFLLSSTNVTTCNSDVHASLLDTFFTNTNDIDFLEFKLLIITALLNNDITMISNKTLTANCADYFAIFDYLLILKNNNLTKFQKLVGHLFLLINGGIVSYSVDTLTLLPPFGSSRKSKHINVKLAILSGYFSLRVETVNTSPLSHVNGSVAVIDCCSSNRKTLGHVSNDIFKKTIHGVANLNETTAANGQHSCYPYITESKYLDYSSKSELDAVSKYALLECLMTGSRIKVKNVNPKLYDSFILGDKDNLKKFISMLLFQQCDTGVVSLFQKIKDAFEATLETKFFSTTPMRYVNIESLIFQGGVYHYENLKGTYDEVIEYIQEQMNDHSLDVCVDSFHELRNAFKRSDATVAAFTKFTNNEIYEKVCEFKFNLAIVIREAVFGISKYQIIMCNQLELIYGGTSGELPDVSKRNFGVELGTNCMKYLTEKVGFSKKHMIEQILKMSSKAGITSKNFRKYFNDEPPSDEEEED